MKGFLKALCAAVLLGGLAVVGFAQGAGPVGGGIKSRPQGQGGGGDFKILRSMNLTKDQMDKVRDLRKQIGEDRKAFQQANKTPDPRARGEFAKQENEKYLAGLQAILTPDEWTKYQQWSEARKIRLPGDERVLRGLGLTPDQLDKIKGLKMDERKANAAFVDDHYTDRDAVMDAVRKSHQVYLEALQKVLTPDQWAQYQQAVQAGGRRRN